MSRFTLRLIGIFALAFVLRAANVTALSHAPFARILMGDARGYDRWAAGIAGGDWIGSQVFYQAPLYPYALGTLYAVAGHDPVAARWAQALLGALACVMIAWAGRRFFSEREGVVAGLILAVYPVAIFFDGIIQKASLDNVLMCALLAAAGAFFASGRLAMVPVIGAILGLFALTRENALVFILVLAAWIVYTLRLRPLRERLRAVALLAAAAAAILVPVGLRNRAVGGDFLITTSQAGSNFYIGNHEGANGRYLPLRPGREIPEFERVDAAEIAQQDSGRALSPGEVSSYWWSKSLDWIRAHPGDWLALFTRKLMLTWNRAEIADTESLEVHAEVSPLLALLSSVLGFGVLLALAIPGMVVAWRARPRPILLYGMLFPFSVAVAAFFVFARYRFPMVPLLILFASAALVAAYDWWKEGKRRLDPAVCVAAGIGVLLGSLPPSVPGVSSKRLAYVNLGIAFAEAGEQQNASVYFRKAVALAPRVAGAHYELGRSLAALRRDDEARVELQTAVELDPGSADAHDELGALLLRRREPEPAEAQFLEAHRIDPSRATTLANLGNAALRQARADEAVAWFKQAIERAPETAIYHYDLAIALMDGGRHDEAVHELQETLRLDPRYAAAYDDLGVTLARRGELDEAQRNFEAAFAIDPRRTSSLINLGGIAASRGRYDQAVTWYRKALAIEPRLTAARLNLATALEQLGRLDEARREASEAARLDPQSPDAARAAQRLSR